MYDFGGLWRRILSPARVDNYDNDRRERSERLLVSARAAALMLDDAMRAFPSREPTYPVLLTVRGSQVPPLKPPTDWTADDS